MEKNEKHWALELLATCGLNQRERGAAEHSRGGRVRSPGSGPCWIHSTVLQPPPQRGNLHSQGDPEMSGSAAHVSGLRSQGGIPSSYFIPAALRLEGWQWSVR